MHPAYFDTMFYVEHAVNAWPPQFAIITAYATTGQAWSADANESADRRLSRELQSLGVWMVRVTGFSPQTGHAEPGWAVSINFESACDLGHRYLQDALYVVRGGVLYLSFCDDRRQLVHVGEFAPRVTFQRS